MNGSPYMQASFTEFIGARVERVDEGVCLLALTVGPQHLNTRGFMHAGVLTSLMDATIGIGLGYLRRDEVRHRPHATIDMNASFLVDGREGDEIEVEGRVTRQGRSIAFGESVARRRPDGEVLALSRLTFAIAAHRRPNVAQGPSPENSLPDSSNVAQGPSPEPPA